MTLGDFNEDGIVDLAVTNYLSNDVSVVLGIGGGIFQAARNIPVGRLPISVAGGDIDNDGHLDLVIANAGTNDIAVLRGQGDGTFISLGAVLAGGSPVAVLLDDFDGDGNLDIAAIRGFPGTVAIYPGNGNGTFRAPIATGAGVAAVSSFASADVNLDGVEDLVIASPDSSGSTISVLLGLGTGSFESPRLLLANRNSAAVAVGDLNGDGKPDIAVANSGSNNVTVLLGNGDGSFQPGVDFFVLGGRPHSLAIADFNGDGQPDIATANYDSNNVSVLLNAEVPNTLVFSLASFIDTAEFAVGTHPYFLVAGDLNGIGRSDLAVVNNGSGDVAVLLNLTR